MIDTAFPKAKGESLTEIFGRELEELRKRVPQKLVKAAENRGRKKGRQEGQVHVLNRQLCHKFKTDALSAKLETALTKLAPKDLDELSERLLEFTTTADLTKWLSTR